MGLGGDIAEILVFDDVLTTDEIAGMTHILGQRWGLVVPTATGSQIAAANALLPVPDPPTCTSPGVFFESTASLAADQSNHCEDWFGVSQPGENLQNAILTMADLSSANLAGALLFNVDFSRANLVGASLINTQLGGAILSGADLTGTTWHSPR